MQGKAVRVTPSDEGVPTFKLTFGVFDMSDSKPETLLEHLTELGYIHPNSEIPYMIIDTFLGLERPVYGTMNDFDKYTFAKLASVGPLRDKLRTKGLHLSGTLNDLTIPSQSLNAEEALRYLDKSRSAMNRAKTLIANTPNLDPTEASVATHRGATIASNIKSTQVAVRRRLGNDTPIRSVHAAVVAG